MSTAAQIETARRQLFRLTRLTDVVYAVSLVMVITWLPLPEESSAEGAVWMLDLFAEYTRNIIAVIIGLVFIILYWLRSNILFSAVDRTDGVHTAFSIASVFFLLFLLYNVRVADELVATSHRLGESVAVALVGVSAAAAWWWARRKDLVRQGMSVGETVKVQIEAFAEPITALVTVPFAFVGELSWNLAWLAYIPVSRFLKWRALAAEASRQSGEAK